MLFQNIPQGKLKKAVYLYPGVGTKAGPGYLHIGPYGIIPNKLVFTQIFHFSSKFLFSIYITGTNCNICFSVPMY
jgi:hypothetical protein